MTIEKSERQLLWESIAIMDKRPSRRFSEFVADLKVLGFKVPEKWERPSASREFPKDSRE